MARLGAILLAVFKDCCFILFCCNLLSRSNLARLCLTAVLVPTKSTATTNAIARAIPAQAAGDKTAEEAFLRAAESETEPEPTKGEFAEFVPPKNN